MNVIIILNFVNFKSVENKKFRKFNKTNQLINHWKSNVQRE